jgi:hypothetical protein
VDFGNTRTAVVDSYPEMAQRHVVVDGSNLATEGRSTPSLAQLDQAVREFVLENPDAIVTVVVDASFGHRIDPSELQTFEEAEAAGEVVSPPAGAIGRGDAFLLRIADKTSATVLSNDSFQEFHGEHEWLFDKGRLIGGKPVPGVGWIFTPRTPVRGPKSREAVKEAKQKKKAEPVSNIPGLDLAAERAARAKPKGKKNVERAIAVATEEAVAPKEAKRRRRRKATSPPAEPVNEPLTFITFIAAHPLGSEVDATIESFSSHGAFADVGGARCYVPLSAMGTPPPKSAREVLGKGDMVRFVIQALDPQRRGIELALPGFAKIAGAPTEETVEAEITSGAEEPAAQLVPAGVDTDNGRVRSAEGVAARAGTDGAPGKRARQSRPAKKAPAGESGEAPGGGRKRAAKKASPIGEKAAAKKAPATKAPAAKSAAAKAPATKAAAAKAAATKAAATKAPPAKAKTPAVKAPAGTTQAAAGEALADTHPTTKQAPTAKQAPTKRASGAKKAPAKKTPADKVAADQVSADKVAADKVAGEKVAANTAAANTAAANTAAANTAAANTAAANTAAAQKAPAKRAPAKRARANKAPVKKVAGEKAPDRQAPAGSGPTARNVAAGDALAGQAPAGSGPTARKVAASEAPADNATAAEPAQAKKAPGVKRAPVKRAPSNRAAATKTAAGVESPQPATSDGPADTGEAATPAVAQPAAPATRARRARKAGQRAPVGNETATEAQAVPPASDQPSSEPAVSEPPGRAAAAAKPARRRTTRAPAKEASPPA